MDKKALQEAIRELARVALIAVIPVLIDSLNKGNFDYRLIATVGIIAILRGIEKYLYENKKTADNPVTNFLKFE